MPLSWGVRVLCVVLLVALVTAKGAVVTFEDWKVHHGRLYVSRAEEALRSRIFYENVARVAKAGDAALSTDTPFMDLSPAEFAATHLMPRAPPPADEGIVRTVSSVHRNDPLPDAWSWLDHGLVTPVRDQASCGSCWAFSAVQAIEGAYAKAHSKLVSFAPEVLVDCSLSDCGCFGGWPRTGMQYLIDHMDGLLMPEAEYPYCIPPFGNCYPCNTNTTFCPTPSYCNRSCIAHPSPTTSARVVSWSLLGKDEEAIRAELYARGPLSIALNAEWFQYYHSGVSDPIACDPTSLDHAVLLVGWGVDGGLLHLPYWLIKNSWGKKWGESGYIRLVRGKGKCGVNTQVVAVEVA